MSIKLSVDYKIENVFILGENYKTCRKAAEIFNNKNPDKPIRLP